MSLKNTSIDHLILYVAIALLKLKDRSVETRIFHLFYLFVNFCMKFLVTPPVSHFLNPHLFLEVLIWS